MKKITVNVRKVIQEKTEDWGMFEDLIKKMQEDPELEKFYYEQKIILEITEKISQIMFDKKISKKELATRLGKSQSYSFGSFLAYLKKIEMKHKREKRRLIYLSIDVLKVVMMEFINSNVFIVKVLFSYKIFISLLFIVGIVEQSLKELGSFMSIL